MTDDLRRMEYLPNNLYNFHPGSHVGQGVEKGIPLSTSARQSLDDAGQLQGLQYDASLLMENNKNMSQMDPIVENTSLINEFFKACNLVIYDMADIDTASQELYQTLNDIMDN